MSTLDWIGFLGVFMILLAYFLNVIGKVQTKSLPFILLNLFGAALACLASALIPYWPFIFLEGVWALVSLLSLMTYIKNRKLPA